MRSRVTVQKRNFFHFSRPSWPCLRLHRLAFLNVCLLVLSGNMGSSLVAAEQSKWWDTFYQYRIETEIDCDQAGWQRIPLKEADIVNAINEIEEFKIDPTFLAYNHVAVIELDNRGQPMGPVEDAGYYLVPTGDELASEALSSQEEYLTIKVAPQRHHLLTHVSSGGGISPANKYETIWPPGSPLRTGEFIVSYFPPLLPLSKEAHEVLFIPDLEEMQLRVGGPYVEELHEISVRQAEIVFLAKVDKPGKKRWAVYYQPMGSHHLQLPHRRRTKLPEAIARVDKIDRAERYIGDTRYQLVSRGNVAVSFADSTEKITRSLPLPKENRNEIVVNAAANESTSFQVVVTPKRPLKFESIKVSDLTGSTGALSSDQIAIKMVEYVPIVKTSFISPARYIGDIGDALLEPDSGPITPEQGNKAFWVTVTVPPGTPAGKYKGQLQLQIKGKDPITVQIAANVYDFELPEFASLKAAFGGTYIAKYLHEQAEKPLANIDYHGIERTKENLKELTQKYYDVMVQNKVCPYNVGIFSEIKMSWTPPPQGYGVDAPGNLFELYDWDFTEYNNALRHYIDNEKANSFCIMHTDPSAAHMFTHLPNDEADKFLISPHLTMAWQTFRNCTYVSYKEIDKAHSYYTDDIHIVTKEQWDDLVKKYFRRIAENLEENGWLDKAYILIDETENSEQLEHLLGLLKSDPLTARIQTVACVQSFGLMTEKDPKDPRRYRFHGLLDTLIPQIDENYNRWVDYFFEDYAIERDRKNLWLYLVSTSRLAIDTPGINNRIFGLDVFRRGGSGILCWELFVWEHLYGESKNPWVNPYTDHANGSLAFFYPPSRDGASKKPDWTITPSLRLESFRQAVNDYEYAFMLENLVKDCNEKDLEVENAESVLSDVRRLFSEDTHWSQNSAWYLDLRKRMAEAIVELKTKLDQS
jgi:hypothetical protein